MILAGTGHRPEKLGGYGIYAFHALIQVAVSALTQTKPEKIISGMALGWDQAFARAAVTLSIPFIAAVPFKGQEDRWPESAKKDYFDLLALASEVVYVSPPGYHVSKLHTRNEWMVDHSDGLITIHDGSTEGGTAACLKYAEKVGKPVVLNVYDEWVKRNKR
jgi:uncharacterized phage-like protein YoqJ